MPSVLHRHLAQAPSRATRRCLSSLAKAAQPSPGGSSVMQSPRPRSRLPNWNLCSYRGQVAPRTVYRRAGNAAEDVAEMARWRGRPGNPWPPRPAQSGRRPRPLPSSENALTGVCTRMFKQHRTRQPKGGRDPNAHCQPRGQAHGSTRRTEHSAVTDALRAGGPRERHVSDEKTSHGPGRNHCKTHTITRLRPQFTKNPYNSTIRK